MNLEFIRKLIGLTENYRVEDRVEPEGTKYFYIIILDDPDDRFIRFTPDVIELSGHYSKILLEAFIGLKSLNTEGLS